MIFWQSKDKAEISKVMIKHTTRLAPNDLYMLTASDSENDLPVFPLLGPASRQESHAYFHNYFSMQQYLPEAHVTKLLPDSAHDAMAYYEYCRDHGIKVYRLKFIAKEPGSQMEIRFGKTSVSCWMITAENPLITLHWIIIRIFRYSYEGVIRTMLPMWERTMTCREVVF